MTDVKAVKSALSTQRDCNSMLALQAIEQLEGKIQSIEEVIDYYYSPAEVGEYAMNSVKYFAKRLKERMNADYIDGMVNTHKGKLTEQDIDYLLNDMESWKEQ